MELVRDIRGRLALRWVSSWVPVLTTLHAQNGYAGHQVDSNYDKQWGSHQVNRLVLDAVQYLTVVQRIQFAKHRSPHHSTFFYLASSFPNMQC
jgi:hypothetical protein